MPFNKLPIDMRLLSLAAAKETSEKCEVCGGKMVELIRINKLMCPTCTENRIEKESEERVEEWTQGSWKARSRNYFNAYSVLHEEELKQAGFKNYRTEEEQVYKAKEKAKQFIMATLEGETPHMILSGDPGRGKSHLAMATLRSILEMSKYTKFGLFCHYATFLDETRESFDQHDKKLAVSKKKNEIMTCDILVLDDIGVDLGNLSNPKEATSWNMEKLNMILEARQNRPTIFTTNLNEGQIRACYGERNYSRMFKHSKGFRIEFKNVTDKRLE